MSCFTACLSLLLCMQPAPFVPETALANEATAITAGLGACVIIFLIVMCVVFRWLALKYLPYLDLLYTAHLQRDHGPQMSKSVSGMLRCWSDPL